MKFGRFFGRSCVSCFGDTKPLKLTDSSPLEMLGLGSFFSFFFASSPPPPLAPAPVPSPCLPFLRHNILELMQPVWVATLEVLPKRPQVSCQLLSAYRAGLPWPPLSSVSWWPGWVPRAPEGALGGLETACCFLSEDPFAPWSAADINFFKRCCWDLVEVLHTEQVGFSLSFCCCVCFQKTMTSWWFQPIWKIWVKMGFFPNRDENQKYLKPPARWGTPKVSQTLPAFLVIEATKSQ